MSLVVSAYESTTEFFCVRSLLMGLAAN